MKKGLYSIIACVLLLGGMVALYFAHNAQEAGKTETRLPGSDSITLLALEKENVVRLETTRPDDAARTFVRDGAGVWSLSGMETPLRQSYLTEMADGLCGLYGVEKVRDDAAGDEADYGFVPPQASLTVTLADGTAATVHIGAQTPAKDYYYMMLAGDPAVYLIYNAVGARYLRGLPELVDSTMDMILTETLQSFSMQLRGESPVSARRLSEAEAERRGGSMSFDSFSMEMTSPVKGKDIYLSNLDEMVILPLNNLALGALVAEATAENLTAYGFDGPAFDAVFEGEGYRYHLTIGNDADGETAYAVYEGLPFIYEIAKSKLDPVYGVSLLSLMDHFVSLYNIDTVDEIVVENHAQGIRHALAINHREIPADTADGAPEKVIYPTANGIPVQDKAFRNYYQLVIGINFDGLDETFVPTGAPDVTVTYVRNGGLAVVEDRYYDYDANFYALLQADSDTAFLVSKLTVALAVDGVDKLLAGEYNE